MVCLILSIQIWKQKQTIIYFCYTYLIYTAITTFSLVILGDTLIHYEQQQGVWGGGTPMGQALYIGLLIVIGIISAFSYLSRQAVLWVIKKIRDRG